MLIHSSGTNINITFILATFTFFLLSVIRVVIFGPPCSGKSTLAQMICQYLNLVYLNMETLLKRVPFELQEEAFEWHAAGNKVSLLSSVVLKRAIRAGARKEQC